MLLTFKIQFGGKKVMLRWKARFKNQHMLNQFDSQGREILFKEVLERQNDLEIFELVEDGKVYQINLNTGMFTINGIEIFLITEQELGTPLRDAHYRIIYYKRMQTNFTVQKLEKPKVFCYLLGWQTTVNGKNFQRILQIFPDGKLFLKVDKN